MKKKTVISFFFILYLPFNWASFNNVIKQLACQAIQLDTYNYSTSTWLIKLIKYNLLRIKIFK